MYLKLPARTVLAHQAVALPGGGKGEIEKIEHRRSEIDVSTDFTGVGAGLEKGGAPDDQRDVQILLIELAAVAVVGMRLAHAFAVVAGDDHERVVGEILFSQLAQKPADLRIGFVN